jgi:GT2 family glycosyltransferase
VSALPRVSVIIPAYKSDATIAATLEALRRQAFADFETIVVDSSPGEGTAHLVAERFPEVRFHHSRERLLPHGARNRGVEMAAGELLVFTDPDCVPEPGWLASLVAARDRGNPVVGGAIDIEGGGWAERGIHLSKFSAWTPQAPRGPRSDLATANTLWTRSLMERLGPFPAKRWSGDTELSWRVRREGIELQFEPDAVVRHIHESGLRRFWRERLLRGEDFAEMRIRTQRWSRARAVLQLLAVPLVPGLLLGRALLNERGGGLAGAIATAPVQLLGYVAWALGEGRALARLALGRAPLSPS